MNIKILTLAVLTVGAASSSGAAFDTCIYVDRAGSVLRMNPSNTTAEMTIDNNVAVTCSILPAMAPPSISSGKCADKLDAPFAVFAGSSDQGSTEDDLLIFRNEVWYRKCAFTR